MLENAAKGFEAFKCVPFQPESPLLQIDLNKLETVETYRK